MVWNPPEQVVFWRSHPSAQTLIPRRGTHRLSPGVCSVAGRREAGEPAGPATRWGILADPGGGFKGAKIAFSDQRSAISRVPVLRTGGASKRPSGKRKLFPVFRSLASRPLLARLRGADTNQGRAGGLLHVGGRILQGGFERVQGVAVAQPAERHGRLAPHVRVESPSAATRGRAARPTRVRPRAITAAPRTPGSGSSSRGRRAGIAFDPQRPRAAAVRPRTPASGSTSSATRAGIASSRTRLNCSHRLIVLGGTARRVAQHGEQVIEVGTA